MTLRNYCYVEHVGLSHEADSAAIAAAFEKISDCDIAVIQVNKTTLKSANNYGVGQQTLRLMDSIAGMKPSALVLMANPYLLNSINSLSRYRSVIIGYEYMPSLLKAAAHVILGYSGANGALPVTTKHYKSGSGMILLPEPPVKIPVNEGFQKKLFRSVDSIALSGITE
jgi:hypothetical protein